jgi:hypothetical protein
MSATIDVYRQEIAMAVASGDHKWIASIAKAFCERCHYYRPWKIVDVKAHVCPLNGLQAHVGIEFDDGETGKVVVGYINGKRRLLLDGEDVACESCADVVHVLQTPCSFFDGIYYAVEGLAAVARSDLKQQIAKWDSEAKECREAFEREFASLEYLQQSISRMEEKVKKAEESLARAISARRLVGNGRTWTMCPVDFESRSIAAMEMIDAPQAGFISLQEAKAKLWGKSGVYFGWRVTDGKCVYVGKSENLGHRLHPRREKLLDCQIAYIEMPPEQIHTWELFFIWLHRPERNKEVIESRASAAKASRRLVAAGSEVTDGR